MMPQSHNKLYINLDIWDDKGVKLLQVLVGVLQDLEFGFCQKGMQDYCYGRWLDLFKAAVPSVMHSVHAKCNAWHELSE